jgi:hypothetical protein
VLPVLVLYCLGFPFACCLLLHRGFKSQKNAPPMSPGTLPWQLVVRRRRLLALGFLFHRLKPRLYSFNCVLFFVTNLALAVQLVLLHGTAVRVFAAGLTFSLVTLAGVVLHPWTTEALNSRHTLTGLFKMAICCVLLSVMDVPPYSETFANRDTARGLDQYLGSVDGTGATSPRATTAEGQLFMYVLLSVCVLVAVVWLCSQWARPAGGREDEEKEKDSVDTTVDEVQEPPGKADVRRLSSGSTAEPVSLPPRAGERAAHLFKQPITIRPRGASVTQGEKATRKESWPPRSRSLFFRTQKGLAALSKQNDVDRIHPLLVAPAPDASDSENSENSEDGGAIQPLMRTASLADSVEKFLVQPEGKGEADKPTVEPPVPPPSLMPPSSQSSHQRQPSWPPRSRLVALRRKVMAYTRMNLLLQDVEGDNPEEGTGKKVEQVPSEPKPRKLNFLKDKKGSPQQQRRRTMFKRLPKLEGAVEPESVDFRPPVIKLGSKTSIDAGLKSMKGRNSVFKVFISCGMNEFVG